MYMPRPGRVIDVTAGNHNLLNPVAFFFFFLVKVLIPDACYARRKKTKKGRKKEKTQRKYMFFELLLSFLVPKKLKVLILKPSRSFCTSLFLSLKSFFFFLEPSISFFTGLDRGRRDWGFYFCLAW